MRILHGRVRSGMSSSYVEVEVWLVAPEEAYDAVEGEEEEEPEGDGAGEGRGGRCGVREGGGLWRR